MDDDDWGDFEGIDALASTQQTATSSSLILEAESSAPADNGIGNNFEIVSAFQVKENESEIDKELAILDISGSAANYGGANNPAVGDPFDFDADFDDFISAEVPVVASNTSLDKSTLSDIADKEEIFIPIAESASNGNELSVSLTSTIGLAEANGFTSNATSQHGIMPDIFQPSPPVASCDAVEDNGNAVSNHEISLTNESSEHLKISVDNDDPFADLLSPDHAAINQQDVTADSDIQHTVIVESKTEEKLSSLDVEAVCNVSESPHVEANVDFISLGTANLDEKHESIDMLKLEQEEELVIPVDQNSTATETAQIDHQFQPERSSEDGKHLQLAPEPTSSDHVNESHPVGGNDGIADDSIWAEALVSTPTTAVPTPSESVSTVASPMKTEVEAPEEIVFTPSESTVEGSDLILTPEQAAHTPVIDNNAMSIEAAILHPAVHSEVQNLENIPQIDDDASVTSRSETLSDPFASLSILDSAPTNSMTSSTHPSAIADSIPAADIGAFEQSECFPPVEVVQSIDTTSTFTSAVEIPLIDESEFGSIVNLESSEMTSSPVLQPPSNPEHQPAPGEVLNNIKADGDDYDSPNSASRSALEITVDTTLKNSNDMPTPGADSNEIYVPAPVPVHVPVPFNDSGDSHSLQQEIPSETLNQSAIVDSDSNLSIDFQGASDDHMKLETPATHDLSINQSIATAIPDDGDNDWSGFVEPDVLPPVASHSEQSDDKLINVGTEVSSDQHKGGSVTPTPSFALNGGDIEFVDEFSNIAGDESARSNDEAAAVAEDDDDWGDLVSPVDTISNAPEASPYPSNSISMAPSDRESTTNADASLDMHIAPTEVNSSDAFDQLKDNTAGDFGDDDWDDFEGPAATNSIAESCSPTTPQPIELPSPENSKPAVVASDFIDDGDDEFSGFEEAVPVSIPSPAPMPAVVTDVAKPIVVPDSTTASISLESSPGAAVDQSQLFQVEWMMLADLLGANAPSSASQTQYANARAITQKLFPLTTHGALQLAIQDAPKLPVLSLFEPSPDSVSSVAITGNSPLRKVDLSINTTDNVSTPRNISNRANEDEEKLFTTAWTLDRIRECLTQSIPSDALDFTQLTPLPSLSMMMSFPQSNPSSPTMSASSSTASFGQVGHDNDLPGFAFPPSSSSHSPTAFTSAPSSPAPTVPIASKQAAPLVTSNRTALKVPPAESASVPIENTFVANFDDPNPVPNNSVNAKSTPTPPTTAQTQQADIAAGLDFLETFGLPSTSTSSAPKQTISSSTSSSSISSSVNDPFFDAFAGSSAVSSVLKPTPAFPSISSISQGNSAPPLFPTIGSNESLLPISTSTIGVGAYEQFLLQLPDLAYMLE